MVTAGYVKLLDPRPDGDRFIRLILGRGGLSVTGRSGRRRSADSRRPSTSRPSPTAPRRSWNWTAELEAAALRQSVLATLLLESATVRAEFIERRLLWQCTTPIRARVAAALGT